MSRNDTFASQSVANTHHTPVGRGLDDRRVGVMARTVSNPLGQFADFEWADGMAGQTSYESPLRQQLHSSVAKPLRRFSARYLLLRYTDTPPTFDPNEIRRLVRKEKAQCTVSSVQYEDSTQYLAFVNFSGKRFQTRNRCIFDVQGTSPSWLPISSMPWKAYDFCICQGTVLWDDVARPSRNGKQTTHTARTVKAPSSSQGREKCEGWPVVAASSNKADFLDACLGSLPLSAHTLIANSTEYLDSIAEDFGAGGYSKSKNGKQPNSIAPKGQLQDSELHIWTSGFKAGFDAGLSHTAVARERQTIPHEVTSQTTTSRKANSSSERQGYDEATFSFSQSQFGAPWDTHDEATLPMELINCFTREDFGTDSDIY